MSLRVAGKADSGSYYKESRSRDQEAGGENIHTGGIDESDGRKKKLYD